MEKINIAELLRDCPKGMELDCPMYDGLEFDRVDEYSNPNFSIVCRVKTKSGQYNFHTFTKYGSYSRESYSKCVIFPKGKATWKGFVPPCQFKEGDIIFIKSKKSGVGFISIYKNESSHLFYGHCSVSLDTGNFYPDTTQGLIHKNDISISRLATEEEQEKLFQVIRDNGYRWNAETKVLEKLIVPKFKLGDRVKHKESYISGVVTKIYDECYKIKYDTGAVSFANIKFQDDYELVPNKFDITTLKPFDKVLVRDNYQNYWAANLYSHYMNANGDYHFATVFGYYKQCIPYNDETKHLLGKTEDCENYYETWE